MNTIDTIAQAIAKVSPFYADYIAEVLNGSTEGEFFEDMDLLARDENTAIEVLDAIDSYCSEHLNEGFGIEADDVHLLIRRAARQNLADR